MFYILLPAGIILVIAVVFYMCATKLYKDEHEEIKESLERGRGIRFTKVKSRDLLNEEEMRALKRALD